MAKEKTVDAGVIETKLYGGKVLVKFMGPTEDKPNRHMYYVNGERKTGVTTFIGIKDKSQALVSWATELAGDHLIAILEKVGKVTELDIIESISLHSEKKQEAADIGHEIHRWCERYIRHKLKEKGYENMPELPEQKEVQIGVNAFLDWETAHKVKFISSERIVYSKKNDFIGQMDIEAEIDRELCMVDLKSSNGLYNTVQEQTAAYAKADEEESGKEYQGRWAIRLAKETEKEYNARMKKKNDKRIKRGKDPIDYGPYQVFEAKYIEGGREQLEYDYKAFLASQFLHKWDKDTDYFKNR